MTTKASLPKKSQIVCEATLSEIGSTLNVGQYLLMGKGEFSSGGGSRVSNVADALESLIAIIFLEKGYDVSKKFILDFWEPYLRGKQVSKGSVDYKSKLQEHLMKVGRIRPEYEIIEIKGPEHQYVYRVALIINGEKVLESEGMSKKKAEQKAAEKYFKR